jgi:CRP/FNR family transcriptional regulator
VAEPKKSLSPELRLAGLEASLRCAQLFSGLPPDDVRRLATLAESVALAKGEYLFREGEASRGFFLVRSGAINVQRVSAAGREQVIHVFRPGETFAEAALASPTGYPADARAVEASSVLLLPKQPMLALLAAELATSSETLSRTFARLRDAELIEVRGATVRVRDAAALRARFRRLLGEG